jgi:hypothetical protein
MTLFMWIGASQVANWQYNFQSAMEVQLIQQDNACPHTSRRTQVAKAKIWLDCATPSPYSRDLAPSDFHLLEPLKDALRDTRFEYDESVIRAVRTWLCEQETSWYREGMHAPVSCWR